MDDFTEALAKDAPGVVAKFEEMYRTPKIVDTNVTLGAQPNLLCRKCGARVGGKDMHLRWHKELSLRIYLTTHLLHQLGVAVGFVEEES